MIKPMCFNSSRLFYKELDSAMNLSPRYLQLLSFLNFTHCLSLPALGVEFIALLVIVRYVYVCSFTREERVVCSTLTIVLLLYNKFCLSMIYCLFLDLPCSVI